MKKSDLNNFVRLKYIESDMSPCVNGDIDPDILQQIKSDFIIEIGDKMLSFADIKHICEFNDISEAEIDLDVMIIKTEDFKKLINNE